MDIVYKVEKDKIKEAKKILEENPYDKVSFARMGYKFKEAKYLGLDGDEAYIYITTDNGEFVKFADEKLSGVAVKLEGDEASKIIEKFKEEEAGAAAGIGSIFG